MISARITKHQNLTDEMLLIQVLSKEINGYMLQKLWGTDICCTLSPRWYQKYVKKKLYQGCFEILMPNVHVGHFRETWP